VCSEWKIRTPAVQSVNLRNNRRCPTILRQKAISAGLLDLDIPLTSQIHPPPTRFDLEQYVLCLSMQGKDGVSSERHGKRYDRAKTL